MPLSRLKIALLLSYICIASASAAIITPALPYIQRAYSLSHGALEWVVSIFLLGYAVGQLLYGPIANRFGRLVALRSGLIINLIGIVLCIFSIKLSNYSLLLIGRLVTALGAASGLSCTFMLLNESLNPTQAKHALSFAIVSFTVGIGLAVTVGGLVTQYLHWQDCFWILLAHGIAMLLLTRKFKETLYKPISLHPHIILARYIDTLKSFRLVVFSFAVGMVSAFAYGYSAAAPIYAQTLLHLSASQYAYWNLINMLGMLGSGLLSTFLMKKYGAKNVLLLGFSLMIPALISLILISMITNSSVLWFFITTALLYLFSGLVFPSASYFASNAISDKASASSMMSFINMGSAMISVIILGYLPFSSLSSFTIIMVIFFIITLLFGFCCKNRVFCKTDLPPMSN